MAERKTKRAGDGAKTVTRWAFIGSIDTKHPYIGHAAIGLSKKEVHDYHINTCFDADVERENYGRTWTVRKVTIQLAP